MEVVDYKNKYLKYKKKYIDLSFESLFLNQNDNAENESEGGSNGINSEDVITLTYTGKIQMMLLH